MPSGSAIQAVLQSPCDLRKGACHARFPGGQTISFSIEPNHLPLLKPLDLTLQISGLDIDSARLLFVGINMDMGFNSVKLAKTAPGQFIGTGILPICTLRRMQWEARIYLESGNQTWVAKFPFYTERR